MNAAASTPPSSRRTVALPAASPAARPCLRPHSPPACRPRATRTGSTPTCARSTARCSRRCLARSAATALPPRAVPAGAARGFARSCSSMGCSAPTCPAGALPEAASLLSDAGRRRCEATAAAAPATAQPATPRAATGGMPADLRLSHINAALATQGLRIAVPAAWPRRDREWCSSPPPMPRSPPATRRCRSSSPMARRWISSSATSAPATSPRSPTPTCACTPRAARTSHHHRLQQLGPRSRHFETLVARGRRRRRLRDPDGRVGRAVGALDRPAAPHRAGASLDWNARGARRPHAGQRRLRARRAPRPRRPHRAGVPRHRRRALAASRSTATWWCAKAPPAPHPTSRCKALLAGSEARGRPASAARDLHRRGPGQPRRNRRQARRADAVLPALARHRARTRPRRC